MLTGGNGVIDGNTFGALHTGNVITAGVANVVVGGSNIYVVVNADATNAGTFCYIGATSLGDPTANYQTYLGTIPFASNAANITAIANGNGSANSALFGTADNYYRNANHHFQNVAGNVESVLVTASGLTFEIDRGLLTTNQTSGAGALTGTLTNSPAVGNPTHWLKIFINGSPFCIPCWPG